MGNNAASHLKQLDLEAGLSKEQCTQVWAIFDKDGDGFLNEQEACEFFSEYAKVKGIDYPDSVARAFFARFDQEAAGKLKHEDLIVQDMAGLKLLSSLNLETGITEAEYNMILAKYDTAGDGALSREDAISFFEQYVKAKRWGNVKQLASEFMDRYADEQGQVKYIHFVRPELVSKISAARTGTPEWGRPEWRTGPDAGEEEGRPAQAVDPVFAEPGVFTASVKRPLGIEVADSKWGPFVQVIVSKGNADLWNKAHPDREVKPCDFLIGVEENGQKKSLVGWTHFEVFSLLSRWEGAHVVLFLRRAGLEQVAYVRQFLTSERPDSPPGEVYRATLGKPFGCSVRPSPWGTYIDVIADKGGFKMWNSVGERCREGRHIQVGDFIIGYVDEEGADVYWVIPPPPPGTPLQEIMQGPMQCGDVHCAEVLDWMQSNTSVVVTLILQRRTLFQKLVIKAMTSAEEACKGKPSLMAKLSSKDRTGGVSPKGSVKKGLNVPRVPSSPRSLFSRNSKAWPPPSPASASEGSSPDS